MVFIAENGIGKPTPLQESELTWFSIQFPNIPNLFLFISTYLFQVHQL